MANSPTHADSKWCKASALAAIILGGLAGGAFRLAAQLPVFRQAAVPLVMTAGFLMLGPLVIGWITASIAESARPRSRWVHAFLPWPSMVLSIAIAWLLNLEGLICVVFALPITFVFSSIGGLLGGAISRSDHPPQMRYVTFMLALPLLTGSVETRLTPPTGFRVVHTSIVIHAAPAIIWQNIERVRPIDPSEIPPTWTHRIGFPLPVEATLSQEGIGGARHATFQHGLSFLETINAWQPNHLLAFAIRANTDAIPATTLDEHVKVGGPSFDVLQGEYRIEPLSDGDVLLHLSSRERLSTDFNAYAAFWSSAVMRDLQQSILAVIKARCERESMQDLTPAPAPS